MGWVILAGFLGIWALAGVVLAKRGASKTISIGGGFLIVTMSSALIGTIAKELLIPPVPEKPLPSAEALFQPDRQWTTEEFAVAAKYTAQATSDDSIRMKKAIALRDESAMLVIVNSTMPMLAAWNDQRNRALLTKYRACWLTAASMSDVAIDNMSMTVVDARVDECRKLY